MIEDLEKKNDAEICVGLYRIRIASFPIWRLFRRATRTQYYKKKGVFNNKTRRKKIGIITVVKTVLISMQHIVVVFLKAKWSSDKTVAFFSYPRLVNFEGQLIDKFTDPVIDSIENIKSNRIYVFDKSLINYSKANRYKYTRLVNLFFLNVVSSILSFLVFPVTFILFERKVSELKSSIESIYPTESLGRVSLLLKVNSFIFSSYIYQAVFRFLNVDSVFVVNREAFFPQILAAKRMQISVQELQHGATTDKTVLYCGEYDYFSDPDYFLSFGSYWKADVFSMPGSRLINIGWGFGKLLENTFGESNRNSILLISSPDITSAMVETALFLANYKKEFEVRLRLHPQEGLSNRQRETLKELSNIVIDDTNIDSSVLLHEHGIVLGDNSTVLYEALDTENCRVGCLNIFGISLKKSSIGFIDNNVEIISDIVSLSKFVDRREPTVGRFRYYDDFEVTKVLNLINYNRG